MAKKEAKVTAKQLLQALGGKENIQSVLHCATRLRVTVKDNEKVDKNKIEEAESVAGYYLKSGQHQVILGTGFVNKVYDEFIMIGGMDGLSKEKEQIKVKSFQDLTKVISDIFIPIIPVLLATGIIMGLQGLLTSLGVVFQEEFNTILSVLTGTAYTFIPVLVCWSAMKKFGGSPVLGIVLGLMLVSPALPDKWQVVNGAAEALQFQIGSFSLHITGYQSSVIPALCLGILAATIEKKLNKIVPDIVQMLIVPFCTLAVSLLLGLFFVGPILLFVEQGLTNLILMALELPFGIGGIVYAGGIQLLCVVGMHHTVTPIIVSLYTATGLDYINPLGSAAIAGQLGAGIGIACMCKDRIQRAKMVPALIPALFGISEPVMYGLTFPRLKPFFFGCIGAAIAGCFASMAGLAAQGTGASMLPGALLYLQDGLLMYVIVLVIAIGVSMILTMAFAKEVKKDDTMMVLYAPVKGEILPVTASSDEMFAQRSLGDGIIVKPEEGNVYAPCSGKISFVYPTNHALGMELSDGTGILIHCGIDTVQLDGKGFTMHVKEGEKVKEGQLLVTFDKTWIEEQGYDTEVIMVASELADNKSVQIADSQSKEKGIACYLVNRGGNER